MGQATATVEQPRQLTALAPLLDQALAALTTHARHAVRGSLGRGQHYWLPAQSFLAMATGQSVSLDLSASQRDAEALVRHFAGEGASVGFPVQIDAQDGLRPMLSLPVHLELSESGIRARATAPLRLNIALLRLFGFTDGELRRLEAACGGEGLLAADTARLIAGRSGLPGDWLQRFEPGAGLSEPPPERPVWLLRGCLLPPGAQAPDQALLNGLAALRAGDPERLASDTALAGLSGKAATASSEAELIWEMSATQPSQLQAIQRALKQPLTTLEAPPGSGPLAMLLSLTATACMRDEKVLYVASSAEGVERFARAWDGALGRDVRSVISLADGASLPARAKALSEYLYLLAKPASDEAEKEDGKGKDREKPTPKLVRELDRTPSPVTQELLDQYRAALAGLGTQPSVLSGGLEALLRLPDIRQLDNQRQGIIATKVSAVRELVQAKLRERLLLDPLALERQCRELFRLAGASLAAAGGAAPAADSELAGAIDGLLPSLPVWAATPGSAERVLPLRPALFDLAIIDEADRLALPELLGIFARARRVLLVGPVRAERRVLWSPAAGAAAPAADLGRPALAAAQALAPGSALRLCELVRAHPVIADYLSRSFYEHKLDVRTDYRTLKLEGEPGLCGLYWHASQGQLRAGPGGPINQAQAGEVIRLLENWQAAKWLTGSQTLAIVAQLPGQPALLQQRLRRSDLTDSLLRRIAVFAADEAPRDAFDYVMLLPGPVRDANISLNASLARSRATFHDAVAAARLGLHVIGDRQAAERAGGPAGTLAALAETWRPSTDTANQPARKRPEPGEVAAEALRRILASQGLPWQEGVRELEEPIPFRVLAPFGGRYALTLSEAAGSEPAVPGLVCLRLPQDAVSKRNPQVTELLRRLV